MNTKSTTIIAVLRDGSAAISGDGQVTLGNIVIKRNSQKVRSIANDTVLAGFAGSAADGFALLARFEEKFAEHNDLVRAAVELAKDWRTDRALRRLEAELLVTNGKNLLLLTGAGDILEPENGVAAIGSGAPYALAAARAMLDCAPALSNAQITEKAIRIAGDICIFTNEYITTLTINAK